MLLFIPPSGHTELADDPKLNSESIDVIVDGDGNGNGAFIHYHFCLVEVDTNKCILMLNDFKPKNGLKCFKMFISALAAQGPELIKTFLEYSDWLKMFNSQSECIKRSIYAPINRYRIGPGRSLSRTFVITLQYTLVFNTKCD